MSKLGLNTEASSPLQPSQQESSSSQREPQSSPPYSPITPVLTQAQLAAVPTPTPTIPHDSPSPAAHLHHNIPLRKIYAHSQEPQTFIPHPLPQAETVMLDDNPDAIALRSAISILQIQRQKAVADMRTLQHIKERALRDPEDFVQALKNGEVRKRPDSLMDLPTSVDDDDEDSDEDMADASEDGEDRATKKKSWPVMPTPQNVITTPRINWAQYGIVGESLDKIHADQLRNPPEGIPATIGPDGRIVLPEAQKPRGRASVSGASGSKMEKMGTRKGGKR